MEFWLDFCLINFSTSPRATEQPLTCWVFLPLDLLRFLSSAPSTAFWREVLISNPEVSRLGRDEPQLCPPKKGKRRRATMKLHDCLGQSIMVIVPRDAIVWDYGPL